jgi:hypothetical protein
MQNYEAAEVNSLRNHFKKIWRNIQKGGNLPVGWKFEMQIKASVIERNSVPLRVSANRLEDAGQYVHAYAQEAGVQIGQAEHSYLSDHMARRAVQDRDIAATQANPTLTHRQAQNIDSLESLSGSVDESEFITLNGVNIFTSGFQLTNCTIQLPKKRTLEALGLPETSLIRRSPAPPVGFVPSANEIRNSRYLDLNHISGEELAAALQANGDDDDY